MVRLLAENASEWTGPTGNNTYLLPDAPAVLIDAGVGRAGHIEAIAQRLDGAPLRFVLITHHHVDHVAGVPALKDRWPEAAIRGGNIGEPFEDGERLAVGGTRLRAIHTPGHAPDHFCFFDESSRDLFCGDLARIGGTVVIPASRGGSLADYLRSLERIRELRPARLLPAHGPVVNHPIELIDEYREHRRRREQQIINALKAGCRTPSEIAARVYPRLSPGLRAAAEETVRAHLEKLGSVGSVGSAGSVGSVGSAGSTPPEDS